MKFGSLEALRGVAALAVVLFHSPFVVERRSWMLENASMFVDFFFILSGFVMAHAYRDRIAAGMSFLEYAVLRLGRIYPVHVMMIGVWAGYLTFMAFGNPTAWDAILPDLQAVLPNLFMVNSIGLQPELSLNYPSWSVGAEMIVYVIFFIAVTLLRNRLTGKVALFISAAAYLQIASVSDTTLQRTYDLGMVRCIGGFFLGVALQDVLSRRNMLKLRTGSELAVCALVIGLLTLPAGSMLTELLLIGAFAAAVFVFAHSDGVLSKALCCRLPAFLGRVSYSIYMVHAIVLKIAFDVAASMDLMPKVPIYSPVQGWEVFLQTPYAWEINAALVLVVISLSWMCYGLVENPCRLTARRWATEAKNGSGSPAVSRPEPR